MSGITELAVSTVVNLRVWGNIIWDALSSALPFPPWSWSGCANEGVSMHAYICIVLLFSPLPFFKHFLMFIFERESVCVRRGGAERQGDTESQAGSRL